MKYLAALALAALSAPAITPAFAQAVGGPETFTAFAAQVATNVDQGRAALVWDRASEALKTSTPKDRFVSQIVRKQQQNGATVSRVWQSVVRSSVTGGRGQLITVTFVVNTNKNTSYNEVVQFTAERDNLWRTSAYIN
jgi:hypothetical protein